jgi:hypothetical protein
LIDRYDPDCGKSDLRFDSIDWQIIVEPKIDRARIRGRQETYLLDHYLSLHNTVVGVALAVAGLGAASLIGSPKEYSGYQLMLWMLWFSSILATATAYAGAMIGAMVLPAQVPAISDLLIPLLIGVSELLLFGVLAHQATGITSPTAVVTVWFFSFSAFCSLAAAAIWRALMIIDPASFTPDISHHVRLYRRSTRNDMIKASAVGLVSLAGGICNTVGGSHKVLEYVIAGAITVGLVMSLVDHSREARRLRHAFR